MEPTKNQIETMTLKGYTIVEYNGADGRVTYKTSSGELRSSRKLSALLSNIRKSTLSKQEKLKRKQEASERYSQSTQEQIDNIKVIKFIKSQNLKLIEPFHGIDDFYDIHCEKHNTTVRRKLSLIDTVGRKIKSLCPECRKDEYAQYYNSLGLMCKGIDIIKCVDGVDATHKRVLCHCHFCENKFERYMDDIRNGLNNCPQCGTYRRKNLPHLYEKYETYRAECDAITDINVNRFKDILKPVEGLTVDHRFSCRNGYDNHIPPWIVAMPYNLEWISMTENNIKKTKNSLTISELFVKFGEFLKEHPWYGESFDKSFVK
jgi:transcription elongation factor Elf1